MRFRALCGFAVVLATAAAPVAANTPGDREERVSAFVRLLDGADAVSARLAASLGTLSGRVALDERLAELEAELEGRDAVAALLELLSGGLPEGLAVRAGEYERDVVRVSRILDVIHAKLGGRTAVETDLRRFLLREDAADLVYASLLLRHRRPNPFAHVLGRFVVEADVGGYEIPSRFRERAKAALSLPEGEPPKLSVWETARVRRLGRYLASRLVGDDETTRAWRGILASECALRVARVSRPRIDIAKTLRDRSTLGRSLVFEKGGAITINRHTVHELKALLAHLVREAGDFSPLLAAASGKVPSRGARWLLAAEARMQARTRKRDPFGQWTGRVTERTASGLRVRPEVHGEIEELLDRVSGVPAAIAIDPGELTFEAEGVHLLRSSIFHNPRTRLGAYYYTASFPDHHTARLFGTFGWTVQTTKSIEEFTRKLDLRLPGLLSMARTHRRIILVINRMPAWLSASDDEGEFEGGRTPNKSAHPPKDMETWRRLIRETAKRFRRVAGVERYYEFWNEPDLEYWQGTLSEFLTLYEETAKVIRATDPEGKIGGAAPNQWPGRIRKSPESAPLNFELIRYAGRKKLPLDFVSWHHFGRPVKAIREAKEAYIAELENAGFTKMPEFLVTEWSVPGRGTPYGAAGLSEMMIGFFEAGVDAQTAACWEEFHARPDPKHFPPWGLITQQGVRKGSWYAHRFFDRLSRGSRGVAVLRPDERTRVVVSRKEGGLLDLILYRLRNSSRIILEFPGAKGLEVGAAESAAMAHEEKCVTVLGNRLAVDLEGYEVLRLLLRLR